MESITLTAPDISCEHCQATIEREIGGMGGIRSVSVDVPSRRIRISFDPSRVSEAQIVARLDEEGYPAGR